MNCLNGERFVRDAIEFVFAQTYSDWEIVFWDNASSDATAEIAKSFDSRLRYFRSKETVPLGKARQWAFAESRGEWIAILDHDDVFLPGRLERQMAAIADGDYALSYCGYREMDERGRLLRTVLPRNKSGWMLNELLSNYEINIATVMMRRAYLERLAVESIASFAMAEDYYLYLGLASKGPVCTVPEVLVNYRQVAVAGPNARSHGMRGNFTQRWTSFSARVRASKSGVGPGSCWQEHAPTTQPRSISCISDNTHRRARRLPGFVIFGGRSSCSIL